MEIPRRGLDTQELRVRLSRYTDAGLLRKAGMRLAGEHPTPEDLELLRRRNLGVAGRVSEDAIRAVTECEPIWILLAEKGLPEDLTLAELDALSYALRGGPAEPDGRNRVGASLLFTDPHNLAALRQIIPGDLEPHEVSGYRYASLMAPDFGSPEPFVVAVHSDRPGGANTVTATMLVADTFLRHEQEFGIISEDAAERLEVMVRMDLQEIIRTHQLLLDA
ncbi:MAG TPA: hypothetical protein VF612_00640 [Jatrophihabitans sp.]|jgi:hypothetical protein|uniref:hypothetical protein n=1 Tax=Jatrophihabitans sp. TaxID=1932789 RepID=UPI002EE34998